MTRFFKVKEFGTFPRHRSFHIHFSVAIIHQRAFMSMLIAATQRAPVCIPQSVQIWLRLYSEVCGVSAVQDSRFSGVQVLRDGSRHHCPPVDRYDCDRHFALLPNMFIFETGLPRRKVVTDERAAGDPVFSIVMLDVQTRSAHIEEFRQ